MYLIAPIAMAIAPSIALLAYFHGKDRERPEPKRMVLIVFLAGVVSIVPAVFLELIVSRFGSPFFPSPLLAAAFEAFVVAGFCEEWMKRQAVKICIYGKKAFDERLDGIIYMITAGLGFACMENVLYVIDGGIQAALIRAFTAIPLHAGASGIMGYFIGIARFAQDKREERALFRRGLLWAVLIHGYYDFVLFIIPDAGLLPALSLVPLLVIVHVALARLIKKAKALDSGAGFRITE